MVLRLLDVAQLGAAQLSPKRSKVHRRPPPKDAALQDLGMWSAQPSPALLFVMLCLAGTANDCGAKGEEGQESLHARVAVALRACEPESRLWAVARTLLPLIPTRTKKRGLCSARL
jgi:hypothetical protein